MAYRAISSMLERFPSRLSATSPSPCGAHDSEFTRIVRILCLSISELDIQQQSNSGKNRFLEHPALDSSAEFVDLRVDLTKVGIILHDRDHRGPSLICRSRTSPMDWCSRYIATFTGMPQQTRARLSAAKITPGPRNRIGMPGHSGGDITSRRQVGTVAGILDRFVRRMVLLATGSRFYHRRSRRPVLFRGSSVMLLHLPRAHRASGRNVLTPQS